MDTLNILSAGPKIYARKRKRKSQQVKEIVFDEQARREYLTGFHKRKLEQRKKATEAAKLRAKKQKAEAKKASRENLRKQSKDRIAQIETILSKRKEEDKHDPRSVTVKQEFSGEQIKNELSTMEKIFF
ncbi:658_t:CDS:2 [Paraglomus brasilianum]|uniref:658_t:CDS:1 n=1 Tax=Paraglomus brasilianum TaxID=144538 RepID=A0A9N9ACB5_9GLOM|nr:658_t:CDS:2 [Paraglomus brasilianum]